MVENTAFIRILSLAGLIILISAVTLISCSKEESEGDGSVKIIKKADGPPVPGQWKCNFDGHDEEELSKSWRTAETAGKGNPAVWQVVEDSSAPTQPCGVAITSQREPPSVDARKVAGLNGLEEGGCDRIYRQQFPRKNVPSWDEKNI